MYKVIIADDERIIREGIAGKIDWDKLGLHLLDLAVHGTDAFEKITTLKPDIVITDIKMPGMNGLELIEKFSDPVPRIKFIILSGYDEFAFAQKAMEHGIKHYLLKPTDPKEISQVLEEVIEELDKEQAKQSFLNEMENELSTIIPLAKKQFLRDRALNKVYSGPALDYYRNLFGIDSDIQVILFELEDDYTIKEMYALEKIVEKNSRELGFRMTTFLHNYLLLLIQKRETGEILTSIQKIKSIYLDFYDKNITVAVSSARPFDQLHVLYQEAREILNYKFYLGKGCMITDKDLIEHTSGGIRVNMNSINSIIEEIVISTRCGNIPAVKKDIESFFEDFRKEKLEKEIIYTYSIDLATSIIRNNIDNIKRHKQKDVNSYFKDLTNIRNSNTINEITDKIKKIAMEITEFNYSTLTRKKNHLVQRIVHEITENIGNEQLNLKWLSKNMVFANVDYLGKVFKKEMSTGFNQYLRKMRMEKAKQMLREEEGCTIYKIAAAVGFGDNSQYFSQVFKKYTGVSPSEYRKNCMDKKTGA